MRIPVLDAAAVVEAADTVLRAREHEIVDGMLDGKPWPAACYTPAVAIARRTRSARSRRNE